jgi:PAS domain S-box-containing protein
MFSLLYVDDEPGLLEIGKLFLESTGDFTVTTVPSGQDGLSRLGQQSFDAVVSDYQMPEMDGIDFLKAVRKSFGSIPFILFTGRGREEVVIEAINNGVDFYLQKGGDPRAQFAELAHKIRQAISRRQAEYALMDSERRLADLINFLPDATFAIGRDGVVIAWNKAIEEMTGVAARDILGKGDYEYALPFYGKRRPILIDLIFEPDEKIEPFYSNLLRDGNTLSAETDLPHPKGKRIYVLAKASPLYNKAGEITGAIEAIRDISDRKQAEEELRAVNEQLAASAEELREQYDELAEGEKRIRESEARLSYMLGFYEYAGKSERELLDYAVEGAGIVTSSPLGYLAFLNDDESELTMDAWSKTAMTECSMREKPITYKTEKTGLWGEAVRQRRPVITNNYEAPNPHKRGYPDGHPRIVRHMNIPVFDEGHIVLVAGVANKSADYTEHDASELSLLMQGLWNILKTKRTEVIRRESEEKYRIVVENSNDSIYIYRNDNLLFANRRVSELTGFSSEELMDTNIWDFIHPDDRARLQEARNRRIAGDAIPTGFTARVVTKSGDIRTCEFVVNVILFQNQPALMGIIRDVTESRRAENDRQAAYEQLAAAEEELRQQYNELAAAQTEIQSRHQQMEEITANVPGVMYQFYIRPDGSMGIYYASKGTLGLLGLSDRVDEFFPSFIDRVHPEDKARFMDSIHEVAKTGNPWDFTGRFFKSSGQMIWFRARSRPVRHGDELVFSGFIEDITEKKKADDELLEKSEELDRFFTMSLDLLCIADTEGRFLRVNPAWEQTLGYSRGELEGKRFLDFVHPEDLQATLGAVSDLSSQKEVIDFTNRYRSRDGTYRWIEWRSRPRGQLIYAAARDITEKKQIENTLDLLRREDHEALRVARMGHFEFDVETKTFVFNDRYYELIGTTAEEMGGYRITVAEFARRFTLPEDTELVYGNIRKGIETDDPEFQLRFEAPFIRPDGTRIWMGIWFCIEKDRAGRTIRFYGVNQDITERKTLENALRESEEKYRQLVENSPNMIYFIDPKGFIRYANSQAAKALRARPDNIMGKHLSEIYRPELARQQMDTIRHVIDSRTPVHREEFVQMPSGDQWMDVRLTPFIDSSGDVIGVLALTHDISDRKQAEEALRESEEKYRQLVENTHDIIYLISPEGILTFVSPSWTDLLGHNTEDVAGKPFKTFVHPADVPLCEDALAKVISSGQRMSGIEYRVFHTDGSIRVHTSTIAPISDKSGTVVTYVGNARDITEMKQFQNAIKESNRKLNLLSSITRHDVANQLTVVQGYTQLAALRKPDPVIADFLDKISSAIETIHHQFEFAKAYQDMGAQAPAWFRVKDVIESVKPPLLTLDCTCKSCEIFADPMIAKVFFNLFDNALRYGKTVTTVTARCERRDEDLVITFADNGIGIPLNEKAKIFEKGYGQHTGFGLFLAREILAITNISIHETGTHGKGARFEITVPKGAFRSGTPE